MDMDRTNFDNEMILLAIKNRMLRNHNFLRETNINISHVRKILYRFGCSMRAFVLSDS